MLPSQASSDTIVVADDNADLADTLAWCLRMEGYETVIAYDGRQAVAAARAAQAKIVILDLAMPQLDGYAAAREIRALLGPDVLIIAHTAWGDGLARQRTREAGFDHHLVKTTDLRVLLELLAARGEPPLH
ncbi:MAG: response regulator [Pseudomonadota bacterium]|nr:response regulator [Pseudomonadota bacterium]